MNRSHPITVYPYKRNRDYSTATHCQTMRLPCASRIGTATHCNTPQHTATHCNTLQHTATHRNTLQHTATHCNTLQRTATHCSTMQFRPTQSIMYVPLQGNSYQKYVLLILQYKYLKSCSGDFYSPESDPPHKIMRYWFYYSI